MPLDAVRIGHVDGDLFDPRCTWVRQREIGPEGAILVRPDRFVAWRQHGRLRRPGGGPGARARHGARAAAPHSHERRRVTALDYDVAIVGYGPVGQTLPRCSVAPATAWASSSGSTACTTCRARSTSTTRSCGSGSSSGSSTTLEHDLLPIHEYRWFGADGEPIMTMRAQSPAPSGWEPNYLFFQPYLEAALDGTARRTASVERGWSAEQLVQHPDHVELTLRGVREQEPGRLVPTDETRTVRARYVIGTDGANSTVRRLCGIEWDDLGFAAHWLTLDLRPHDIGALDHLPTTCQWCDPAPPPHAHTQRAQPPALGVHAATR